MYYIDCSCAHDIFKEFERADQADDYYEKLPCIEKVLYTKNADGKFVTLREKKRVSSAT